MVVQQGLPIPVWGWTSPHQRVVASLGGCSAETQADAKGSWMVRMPRLQARDHLGSALTLRVAAEQEELTVEEVAVGEVWLCAGQRALPGLPAGGASPPARRSAGAPPLRLFRLAPAHAERPRDEIESAAGWQDSRARANDAFGALASSFAAAQQQTLGVPLGVILAASAQAAVESWVSRAALASEHQLRGVLERAELSGMAAKEGSPAYCKLLSGWQQAAGHPDPGNRGVRRGWHQPACAEDDWRELSLPGRWDAAGYPGAGACWLRRTVALPPGWRGHALTLALGRVAGAVRAYVNGTPVGASDDADADGGASTDAAAGAHSYPVPARLVRGATLTIALRLFACQRPGGLVGAPDELSLAPAPAPTPGARGLARARPATIALAGPWLCRAELELARREAPPPPLHSHHAELPAALNNGMIQPLVPYGLRGALWLHATGARYQAEPYRALLAALVRDWRTAWGQGEFPFALVQLPDGASEALRAAARAAAQQAHAGVVDAGALDGAPPPGLDEIGQRLAGWARAVLPV